VATGHHTNTPIAAVETAVGRPRVDLSAVADHPAAKRAGWSSGSTPAADPRSLSTIRTGRRRRGLSRVTQALPSARRRERDPRSGRGRGGDNGSGAPRGGRSKPGSVMARCGGALQAAHAAVRSDQLDIGPMSVVDVQPGGHSVLSGNV
jgi:hypothetical protein